MPALLTSTSSGPELALDPIEEAGEALPAGHVERQSEHGGVQLAGDSLSELAVEVADRDARSLRDQRCRGRAADPARTAGDRHDLAVQGSEPVSPSLSGLRICY